MITLNELHGINTGETLERCWSEREKEAWSAIGFKLFARGSQVNTGS